MNLIQSIMADCAALLKRIETEIGGTHPTIATASAGVKTAATAIAQHPLASATPSAIVSPGMIAPETETVAPVTAAAPASDAPEAAPVVDPAATPEVPPVAS